MSELKKIKVYKITENDLLNAINDFIVENNIEMDYNEINDLTLAIISDLEVVDE